MRSLDECQVAVRPRKVDFSSENERYCVVELMRRALLHEWHRYRALYVCDNGVNCHFGILVIFTHINILCHSWKIQIFLLKAKKCCLKYHMSLPYI